MKNFWHREAAGDIIYALMALKAYHEQTGELVHLGISRNGSHGYDQLTALKRLVEAQSYIASFTEQPFCGPSVDMRHMIDNGIQTQAPSLPREYFAHMELPWLGYAPWLENISPLGDSEPYSVVNVTERYRVNSFHWGTVLPAGEMRFLGTELEYTTFYRHLCNTGYGDAATRVTHTSTLDLYDAARHIAGARAFFGNASACLTIAQGLGQCAIFGEFDVTTLNTCRFGHEKVLNAISWPQTA